MLSLCHYNQLNLRPSSAHHSFLTLLLVLLLACSFIILAVSSGTQAVSANSFPVKGPEDSTFANIETALLTRTIYLPLVFSFPITYPRRITSGLHNDTQPRFSPDGKYIVFTSDRDGYTDVFSMGVEGGLPVNLTRSLARSEDTPIFSPDGGTIAYASDDTLTGDWDIFLMNPDGSNKRVAIQHAGSDEVQPWFSLDGQSLYFSSNINVNWDIFRVTINSDYITWSQLTTDLATDRFPVLSPDGTTVVFRSERDGNSNIYLMNADGTNQRPFTTHSAYDSYGEYTSDMSGIVFDSDRSGAGSSFLVNPAGTNIITFETRSDWEMKFSDVSKDGMWRVYASKPINGSYNLYVDRFISPLMTVGQKGMDNVQANCDWEAGILAYGWSQVWQTTHQTQYLQWLKDYVNRCIPNKTISHVNDALLGHAALVVYQDDPQPAYLTFAQNMADWIMTTAQRTPDGTLSHPNDGDSVWCDTVMSVPPFLVKMSQVTSNTTYFDEAVSQVLKHANRLQDPLTGLYHHAWSARQNQYIGPAYWSRGNGWVMMGNVAVLSAMTDTHPSRITLLNILHRHAAALKPLQDSSGLWTNVVDHANYYLETSGTALIGYAFKQGIKASWLDSYQYAGAAQAASLGVWRKISLDGLVTDVMVPTGPQANEAVYNTLPHSDLQLYGQGVALLLEIP